MLMDKQNNAAMKPKPQKEMREIKERSLTVYFVNEKG